MADYAPPDMADLYALVGRDLTDPNHQVFNISQITDFVNGGIAEINRVKPLETTVTISYDTAGGGVPLTGYPVSDIFLVELIGPQSQHQYIPHARNWAVAQEGWDYFANRLTLGPVWEERVTKLLRDNGYKLRVWGYRPRDPLIASTDIAEFVDLNDEMTVRLYCRLEAYRALNQDRGLFQQWQMQPNNSDVSPTQLNGMLATSEGAFDRQIKRIFVPRRIPSH